MPHQTTEQLVALFNPGGFSLEFVTNQDKKTNRPESTVALEMDLYKRYKASHEDMVFYFSFLKPHSQLSDSLLYIHQVGKCFLWDLSRTESIEDLREYAEIGLSEESERKLLSEVPFAIGRDAIDRDWIIKQYKRLNEVFSNQIGTFTESVAAFLESHDAIVNVAGRVFFHLVESKVSTHPFAFLATYSATRTLEDHSPVKSNHIPLKNALLEFKNQQDQLLTLLSTVSKAAQKSMLISELVESGELFSPLKFTAKEAYTFLKEIPLYEACGILCRMPDWWKQNRSQFKVSINVGDREPSRLGMEALMGFDAALMLGDDVISEEEVRAILSESNGLALIKGNWVEVDHERLQATLEAYEKAKKIAAGGQYTMAEAMRLQLTAKERFSQDDEDVIIEVSQGQWIKTMMKQLAMPENRKLIPLGDGFKATLRGYQQKGLEWLHIMKAYGFGACLADDMGLGKTVQVIALLEQMRHCSESVKAIAHKSKTLLVMPASLMGNWQRELEKFAPLLSFQLVYSTKDILNFQKDEPQTELYLTTYGMVSRHTGLKEVHWDLLILDEAQAIKNPGTKQTKAVKGLHAKARIALTGTPIENSLSDLWSLFDFLNTGLLGTAKEFQGLTKKLRDGNIPYSKLRDVVSPFILRRLKTDKTVIDTLPEKLEMKAYTTLSKKQIVLYSALLKEIEQQLNAADGIARKGLVLASLMKFKQICNHPDQYLGQKDYHHEHSGKFERLTEICETIYEKRERVLVFTQFREMVEPISHFLEKLFNRKGLILHGGTPIKQRPELVDQFNGEEYVPFMVLSLKAGGVGLNLTAANHVIHFDRWWNPAVENQATDRAYRIGQERDVMVHKFITMGTIEEKIDAMIEAKSQLSDELISTTGEAWITELSNDELLNLFRLS
jgi:non-specific serine/threonine protein kinase